MADDVDDSAVIEAGGANEGDLDGELGGVPVEVADASLAMAEEPGDELGDAGPVADLGGGLGGLDAIGGDSALTAPAADGREALEGGGASGVCGGGVGLGQAGGEPKDLGA